MQRVLEVFLEDKVAFLFCHIPVPIAPFSSLSQRGLRKRPRRLKDKL